MTKAMYAFSGDPITYGHIDIISRASKVFEKVLVGIGVNPDKKYMFNLEERTEMAKKSLQGFSNVEVLSFRGLLVDYAYEQKVDVIVKGVRNSADFDYENTLHNLGESQNLGIDTHILFARSNLSHVSSSAVKAIQKEQGLIHEYVPLYVKQCLEEKMSGQYIIGVTGEIGVGKSYVCEQFVKYGKERGISIHNIDLDHIGHQIISDLQEPRYQEVRNQIVNLFGEHLMKEDGSIDRKVLGGIVFSTNYALKKLNEVMATPLLVRLRRELYGKSGLILFNAALIAETEMSYLCNNNCVVVYSDKDSQHKRLLSRGLQPEQMQRRIESQFSFVDKKSKLQKSIEESNHGNIFVIDNSIGKDEIFVKFNEILGSVGLK